MNLYEKFKEFFCAKRKNDNSKNELQEIKIKEMDTDDFCEYENEEEIEIKENMFKRNCLENKGILYKNDIVKIEIENEINKDFINCIMVKFIVYNTAKNDVLNNICLKIRENKKINLNLESQFIQELNPNEKKELIFNIFINSIPFNNILMEFSADKFGIEFAVIFELPIKLNKLMEFRKMLDLEIGKKLWKDFKDVYFSKNEFMYNDKILNEQNIIHFFPNNEILKNNFDGEILEIQGILIIKMLKQEVFYQILINKNTKKMKMFFADISNSSDYSINPILKTIYMNYHNLFKL